MSRNTSVQEKSQVVNTNGLACDFCGRPGARVRTGETEALCSECFCLDVERLIGNLVAMSARQVEQIRQSVAQAQEPPSTLVAALARIGARRHVDRHEINEIAVRHRVVA